MELIITNVESISDQKFIKKCVSQARGFNGSKITLELYPLSIRLRHIRERKMIGAPIEKGNIASATITQ